MKISFATFHDFYYDDKFLMDQTRAAELQIDKSKSRRDGLYITAGLNPDAACNKEVIDYPLCLHYHIAISKLN